jgi:hypothetical protein
MKHLNKKGVITDIILAGALLFLFVIATFFSYTVYMKYTEKAGDELEDTDTGKLIVTESKRAFYNMDYAFLLVFIGLFISTVVTAFLIRSHPIFFVLSIMLLFIVLFSAVLFSNIFEKISESPRVANATDTYVIMPHIMDKLPTYIFGLVIVAFIVFFAKWRLGGE